ncbi:MAG: hypothetical protein ACRD16_06025 [Thermoanaerobaculia bacterium]
MRVPRPSFAAAISIGIALRVALFLAASPGRRLYVPDSFDYLVLARNLAAGGPFSRDARPPFRPEILRTPVYPSFLAGLARMGLPLPSAGTLAGVFLSVLAVILVRAIALERGVSRRGADVAALLVALDLGSAAYANFLLSEALFVALLLLAFQSLGGSARESTVARSLRGGALLGLAILCRPIALGLPLVLSAGRRLRMAVLVVGSSAAVVVPWMIHNAAAAGSFTVSSVASVNLYYHRAEKVLDARQGREEEPPANPPGENDPSATARMRKEGFSVLWHHPGTLARLTLKAWARTFGPDERPLFQLVGIPVGPEPHWLSRGASREPANAARCENLFEGVFLIFLAAAFLRGIAAARNPGLRPVVLSALSVVGYFLLVSGPEYYGRFRVPIIPFLALVAGAGFRKRPEGCAR